MRWVILILAAVVTVFGAFPVVAQSSGDSSTLTIATISRPPFSMVENAQDVGFSVDLWRSLAEDIGLSYDLVRYDSFADMLGAVENGEADAAIANISITLEREQRMDFTQPFFETGVQILLTSGAESTFGILRSIFSPFLALAMIGAFVLLFGIGMLMWFFERKHHDLFGKDAKEAAFPAFWWALNLLISSGYEEEMPRSPLGRVFGVLMVIASLFVVSIFVANITAAMTLNALTENVNSIDDLDGLSVGTTAGSTTSAYLDLRGIDHKTYESLDSLYGAAFVKDGLDAVVFDGPILAYFMRTEGPDDARLIDRIFKRENYGIALTQNSPLREPLNRALLNARENGLLDELRAKWFGSAYSDQ